MTNEKKLEKIREYYAKGIYKQSHLRRMVETGALTEEAYEAIVGGDSNG